MFGPRLKTRLWLSRMPPAGYVFPDLGYLGS